MKGNGMYEQDPPFTVQIELCEGCNRFCKFCGIHGIRTGPGNFKFAELSTIEHIARLMADAGWTARICFAMHGEPTMNPMVFEAVDICRKNLPNNYLMMLSNGGGLLHNTTARINALFEAGLNVLVIDAYEEDPLYQRVINQWDGDIRCYPAEIEANPHKRRGPNVHEIIIQQDISIMKADKADGICNHCGCAAPKNNKLEGKRCAKVFREFSIRWNGNISHCCNDFRGIFHVGSILEVSDINQIWNHPRMDATRHFLYHGMREFAPCRGCDAYSFRVGLLPDKMGWEYLEKPTLEHHKLVLDALEGEPYSHIVERQWEI